MKNPYTTLSWQSEARPEDDTYVDRITDLIDAIASRDESRVAKASAGTGVRRLPMQPVADTLPRTVETNGRLTRNPSRSVILSIFERDHYTCRYCGTRAISLDVLHAASAAARPFGDVLLCHDSWRIAETHPVYWWQSVTVEHVHAVSRGGDWKDPSNLVTACWPCQSRKGNYMLDELGWSLLPIADTPWCGLLDRLELLNAITATQTPDPAPSQAPPQPVSTRRARQDRVWTLISLHPTSDGRDGALIRAAGLSDAPDASLTTRGALRVTTQPDNTYYSHCGNWRARQISPVILPQSGGRNRQPLSWALELADPASE